MHGMRSELKMLVEPLKVQKESSACSNGFFFLNYTGERLKYHEEQTDCLDDQPVSEFETLF